MPGRCRLPISARALDGVYLDLAPIALDAGASTLAAATALLAVAAERGVATAELAGTFGADPIGAACAHRSRSRPRAARLAGRRWRPTRRGCASPPSTPRSTTTPGGSDADELAIAAVGRRRVPARADRRPGSRSTRRSASSSSGSRSRPSSSPRSPSCVRPVRSGDGSPNCPARSAADRGQYQHAVTSRGDAHPARPVGEHAAHDDRLLRRGGRRGGRDHRAAVRQRDRPAGRLRAGASPATPSRCCTTSPASRGSIDAGGGSWYVESLTADLAEAAWQKFTAIERAGGALAALDDGTIAALLAATRAAARRGHRAPPRADHRCQRVRADHRGAGRRGRRRPHRPRAGRCSRMRYAAGLRGAARPDRCRRHPPDGLPRRDRPVRRVQRAGRLRGEPVPGGRPRSRSPGPATSTRSSPRSARAARRVACLCSSDKVYAEQAEPVAAALRRAGATLVWLAGKGAFDGVDGNLFVGCDALSALRTTLETLGVPA